MILTRYAARIAKPIWSSACYQNYHAGLIANIPYRTITTGRDHQRYCDDPKELDVFLGKWTEMKAEVKRRVKNIEKGILQKELSGNKTWILFSRTGDKWTCKRGFVGSSEQDIIKFVFNKEKIETVEGILKKFTFSQEGKSMIEKQEKFGDPSNVTTIVRTLMADIMTATFSDKDGEVLRKMYAKGG